MFDNKAKQQLEGLLSDLRNWGDSVEARAESFHRLRRLLQGDIETELKRLFPRKNQAENYIQRHRPLSKLALDLGDLLNQSQALDAELDELLILFTHERELSTYGEDTCRQWREELHNLPTPCERETDVTRAKQEAEQIGQAVKLHIEALRAFQEADAVIRRLGSDADTAALETELQRSRLAMAAGRVSLEGARQIKKLLPDCQSLFILPPSREALWQRLQKRGQDNAETIERRMRESISEMSHFSEYDYLIINDDFDKAVNEMRSIVVASRLKTSSQSTYNKDLIANLLG